MIAECEFCGRILDRPWWLQFFYGPFCTGKREDYEGCMRIHLSRVIADEIMGKDD